MDPIYNNSDRDSCTVSHEKNTEASGSHKLTSLFQFPAPHVLAVGMLLLCHIKRIRHCI